MCFFRKKSRVFRLVSIPFVVILVLFAVFILGLFLGVFPKRFFSKSYDTRLFAKSISDSSQLKLARFDVDFIASFVSPSEDTKTTNKYLALYPFVVEAELDLDSVKKIVYEGVEYLEFPKIEVRSYLNNAGSQVFCETLDLDYQKHLSPVLQMFREKSRDYALQNDLFLSEAVQKTFDFFESVFAKSNIVWEGGLSEEDKFLPRIFFNKDHGFNKLNPYKKAFKFSNFENFQAKIPNSYFVIDSSNANSFDVLPGFSFRDCAIITSNLFDPVLDSEFRFGLANINSEKEILSKASEVFNSHPILFKYHSPIDVEDNKFTAIASENYSIAFIYNDALEKYYYLESTNYNDNDALSSEVIAKNLLYTAASVKTNFDGIKTNIDENVLSYNNYVKWYTRAFDEAVDKRFGKTFNLCLKELDIIFFENFGKDSSDVELFKFLANRTDNFFDNADKNFDIDKLNEKINISYNTLSFLQNFDYSNLDDYFRDNIELLYFEKDEIVQNLKAFFYLEKDSFGITNDEAEKYKVDLINSGKALSKDLLNKLSLQERNILFGNFFGNSLDLKASSSVFTPEDNPNEAWLFIGNPSIEYLEKKGFTKIREKIISRLNEPNSSYKKDKIDGFVLFFSNPIDRSGFFANYNAFVILEDKIFFIKGVNSFFTHKIIEGNLSEIVCLQNDILVSGKFTVKQKEIANLFKQFVNLYLQAPYNKQRAELLIGEDLEKEVLKFLFRF